MKVSFRGEKFELIDIKVEPALDGIMNEFESLSRMASSSNDALATNYINIVETLPDYEAFTLIKHHGAVVAFSGLYRGHFPAGIARALTRTYYAPSVRARSLSGQEVPGLATGVMLPYQVSVARRLGYDCVFVSMQGEGRTRVLGKVFRKLNEAYPERNWEILEGLYNTCRPICGEMNDREPCWQNVALLKLNGDHPFPLPRKRDV